MSYIITDDKHYKNIAKSLRSKMQTDREYYPEDMAIAIDNIPSSADGTDNPVTGIYFLNPNDNGYPTKIKVSGFNLENKETKFPLIFTDNIFKYIEDVEFINCNFKYFSDSAFAKSSSLTTINLPDSLTSISWNAFINCTSLTTINLPSGLTSIGSGAFQSCTSLTTINLPSGLTSIGMMTFAYCYSLTTINLPNSLTYIDTGGYGTFTNCASLEYVTLGNNFNCNNLNLSSSTKYTRETILQWLNALADRTGQTAYKLTIGAKNLAKLTEEDILIATNKNWTLA